MKIHAPLIPIVVCLILGIVLGEMLDEWSKGFILLIPLLFVTVFLRHFPRWQTAGIWACVVVLGAMLSSMKHKALSCEWPQEPTTQEIVVSSETVVKEKAVVFDALISGQQRKIKCRVAKDETSKQITIGDRLLVHSTIRPIHQYQDGHFDYQRYMLCHEFSGETFVGRTHWQWQERLLAGLSLTERLKLRALCWRHQLLAHYRQWGFDQEAYGVIAAMTLGDKSQLDTTLKDTYAIAGASHVLALSGLHLMIIYAFITLFTGWWRFRTLSQILTVLPIWAFAFLVGLSPSVVRSAFMISVYALLSLGYRERMSVNTLAFTAIVMLVMNPFALYDIGFQLSFMAVLAIVLLNPLFSQIIPLHVLQRHRWLNAVWGLTTVSLAAQIGTAPLVIYYFGRFATYFLLSNYVVIPLATLILNLALACVCCFWWVGLQQLLTTALMTVVSFMNQILTFIAHLPKSSVEDIRLSTLQLYLIYIIIGCLWVVLSLYRKNVKHLAKV